MTRWAVVFGPRIALPDPLPSDALPPDVELRRSRWLPALAGRLGGMGSAAAAVTIGRNILVHPRTQLSARLLRHELAHVRQWERSPLRFPLTYVWQHVRHGYDRNPFELEARRAEAHDP